MLSDFLDNSATITRDVINNNNGLETITETTIYTNIDCHIYSLGGSLNQNTLSVNTDNNNWRMIIEWDKTSVKIWDKIEITDPSLWNIGEYQITTHPKANRLINGTMDSIQFNIKSI